MKHGVEVPIAKHTHTHNATTKEIYKAFMTRHAFYVWD